MPIRDADRRLRLLGKIRLGEQVEATGRDGKKVMRPAKLTSPRLTSPTRDYLDAAAAVYGGEVTEWEGAPGEGRQWQLHCAVDTLDIVVPPVATAHSDWYEMWSAGGCARRCDGITETLTGQTCQCPADKDERRTMAAKGQACKMTTRLNVLLPKIPDVGVWMIESHGYYAWSEIGGVVEFLAANAPLSWVPGRLRLEARTAKRRGPDGKPITHNFVVPVIELPQVTAQALGSGVPVAGELTAARPALAPSGLDPATGEVTVVGGPQPFSDDDATLMPSDRQHDFVVKVSDLTHEQWPRASAKFHDAVRHAVIGYATGGRTSSSKAVRLTEEPWINETLSLLRAGELRVDQTTSPVRLVEADPAQASA